VQEAPARTVLYRGRFAPTPSGPLHFGSIVAAVASFADALANAGEWHLRIDDLDPPRVAPGATDAILACLERLGFTWHGPVVFQSARTEAYADALQALRARAHTYACTCSRKEIAAAGLAGIEGPRYPGTCRARAETSGAPAALRIDARGATVLFRDLLQGTVEQSLERAVGDFVLRRADGVYSYHLACVVDDALDGFTHVVRGADLLDSTARQIWLQQLLGYPQPAYLHVPVATDPCGTKLSKQTCAPAVDSTNPWRTLAPALRFLGHPPPTDLCGARGEEILGWVARNWDRARIPRLRHAPASADPF
jgi:glutamyl-Q tRNA(Asp) synthetase